MHPACRDAATQTAATLIPPCLIVLSRFGFIVVEVGAVAVDPVRASCLSGMLDIVFVVLPSDNFVFVLIVSQRQC
jgi:hypothetical protein